MDSSSLNKVSGGSKHSYTTVLKFGSTEPVQSLGSTNLRVTKGVELLERGCATGNFLKIDIKGSGNLFVK